MKKTLLASLFEHVCYNQFAPKHQEEQQAKTRLNPQRLKKRQLITVH